MKQHSLSLLVLFLSSNTAPPLLCNALSETVQLPSDEDEEGTTATMRSNTDPTPPRKNRSTSRNSPSSSSSSLRVKIDDTKALLSRALSEKMSSSGENEADSGFVRILQEEIQRQEELASTTISTKENNTNEQYQNPSSSSTKISSSAVVLEYHPSVYGGLVCVLAISLALKGSIKMLKETLIGVSTTLAVAWLPALTLRSSWVELLSISTVIIQPNVRNYLRKEIWPMLFPTIRKIILAESWRQLWLILLAPLPKPLFVPRTKDYYTLLPHWVQRFIETCNKYVDKFAQRYIQKLTEKSVHDTVGFVFTSVTDSMGIELTFLYDNDASVTSSSASAVGTDDDDDDDDVSDDEAEGASMHDADDDDDGMVCEGGVCYL